MSEAPHGLLAFPRAPPQAPPAAAQQQQQRRRQDGGPRAPGRAHPPQHPAPAAAARHGAGGGTGALSGQQDGAAVEEEARRPLLWVVMVADLCDLPVEVAEGGRVLPDGDAVGSAPWGGPAATALPLTLSVRALGQRAPVGGPGEGNAKPCVTPPDGLRTACAWR